MPVMPPFVSTSTTRKLRASPKAWPLSHGVCGHGTRSMVVRTAVMVMSLMAHFPPCCGGCCGNRRAASTASLTDHLVRLARSGSTAQGDLQRTGGAHAEDPNHLAKAPPTERAFFPRHHGGRARPPRL